ncbi:hypothetical protein [Streptomyces sp. NPDC048172]|uniref:hypothetical protein n=1 Tax=Streptomyces sp. NPDC048172 TaxID=3365505 RepID=UPI003712AF92
MPLRFVGIDPETNEDHCPTVWVDEAKGELVVHGWKASSALRNECEANFPANGPIPEYEDVVRLPARMMPMIRKACDALDGSRHRHSVSCCSAPAPMLSTWR